MFLRMSFSLNVSALRLWNQKRSWDQIGSLHKDCQVDTHSLHLKRAFHFSWSWENRLISIDTIWYQLIVAIFLVEITSWKCLVSMLSHVQLDVSTSKVTWQRSQNPWQTQAANYFKETKWRDTEGTEDIRVQQRYCWTQWLSERCPEALSILSKAETKLTKRLAVCWSKSNAVKL